MINKILSWVYLCFAGVMTLIASLSDNTLIVITAGIFGLFSIVMSEIKDVHAELEKRKV